ncbi:MAG: hypothetical protein WAU28_03385 [Candidatus Moraniibacteriota bacterium]
MGKNPKPELTKTEKEAIAEQVASFFFGYWEARSNSPETNSVERKSEAIVLASGLSRNFPDNPKTVA